MAVPAQNDSRIPTLTKAQWREDVRFFAHELTQRHRNSFHRVTKAEFDRAEATLEAEIPTRTDTEIVVGIQRLAAMIGDGHTFLGTWEIYRRFPLEVFWFGTELRVVRADARYQRVLGAKITRIGGHDIAEVQRRIQAIIPQGENEWFILQNSAGNLMRLEPLIALGVLPRSGDAVFTFKDDAGKRFEETIAPVAPDAAIEWTDAISPPPLGWQKPEEGFWIVPIPDKDAVYVNFRYYDAMERDAKKLFDRLKTHPPKRLIIDLRQNGGGNYTKAREHLIYPLQFMPSLNRAGHLFVLIGRGTFSAAMTGATDFRRETEAILVGEPTGANPNGYQELSSFTLPHSKLQAFCSLFRYRFQHGDATAVSPDQRIAPDWASYKAGRDSAVEWCLSRR